MGAANVEIVSDPVKSSLKKVKKIIDKEDAAILVSAVENSDFLLTLDKDFLSSKVLEFVERKGLLILTPREFLNQYGKN